MALADVNLQTVIQMGGAKSTPVIATQAVPMVSASTPIVRRYREVLGDVDTPTRTGVLAAFQRRSDVDVGGYRVSFNAQRRSATYVTQSMLTADGRVVG